MTGVRNKHAFQVTELELDSAIRRNTAADFAVVVCDVNGLICDLFKRSPVFRTGGDEFVIVLQGRDYENRETLMENMRRISESRVGTDQAVVSSGISDYVRGSDESCHAVFERADKLMYENKEALKRMGARSRS